MFGFDLVKSFGVGTDWFVGNLWRRLRGKPRKTYKEIWNGDAKKTKDELDNAGYHLSYVVIGFISIVVIACLLGWILDALFPGQTFF